MSYAAITASTSTNLLTSLARVKERLYEGDATITVTDDMIEPVLYEISNWLQTEILHRWIASETITEYANGSGRQILYLRGGPLVSVTSVAYILYESESDQTRKEVETTVHPYEYLEGGLGTEDHTGRAHLIRRATPWTRGARNYKVVYVAGFTNVPETIVRAATETSCAAILRRRAAGMTASGENDFLAPRQVIQYCRALCSSYIFPTRRPEI